MVQRFEDSRPDFASNIETLNFERPRFYNRGFEPSPPDLDRVGAMSLHG
jgi:hypothetical protein